ncbi:MAG TPA: hypothetical protein VEI07_20585 [Planctomycetaceae bacterium]|nr:hypothetical protein [Planctomycetaceae bacterium]
MKTNSELREIPLPDSYDEKEVFAFFGLAAYYAQVFEQAALHLAAALEVFSMSSSSAQIVESVYGQMEKATLGRLLARARRTIAIDHAVDDLLSAALEERNYLTHKFFDQHSENFIVNSGRKLMIDRLREATALFQRADRAATKIFWPTSSAMGVTEEMVNEMYAQILADAEAREAALSTGASASGHATA